jgi:AcrR family transcriptional regulator
VAKRLGSGRREELLDGVMRIISERGFADVRIADIAEELHCSVATLYKIAPNKDSLLVLAIRRWGDIILARAEDAARSANTPTDKARRYYLSVMESLVPLTPAFRFDMERFESTSQAFAALADRFIDRFVQLLDEAVDAGEARPINTRFFAHLFRQMALLIRDGHILVEDGITADQAMAQIDAMIWDGIRMR